MTDLIQLAIFGFFTGFGLTFGTELAKTLITKTRKRLNHKEHF